MGIIVKMLNNMAEEPNVTPEAEVIAPPIESVAEIANAPVVETEVVPVTPASAKAPETVPLAVYLELKDDMKTLKQEIKESKNSDKATVEVEGIEDLAKKYPDVNHEFIRDMVTSATKVAESKYNKIIEEQDNEKKKAAFNTAFDALFTKTTGEMPGLPKNIDKEMIKELSLTPKYRNVPLAKILTTMYGEPVEEGKASSENEARSSADKVEDIVSFDRITPEQKREIMADDKARTKYFAWLDQHVGR